MRFGIVLIGLLMTVLLAACDPRTDNTPASTRTVPPTRTIAASNPQTPSATFTLSPSATRTPTPRATRTRTVLADAFPSPTPVCSGAQGTRLIVNERGRVLDDDPRPLNVRSGPGTEYRIFGRLEVLDVFLVTDGPLCGDGYAWFKIQRGILEGWIAEGDSDIYYVEPYLPG